MSFSDFDNDGFDALAPHANGEFIEAVIVEVTETHVVYSSVAL